MTSRKTEVVGTPGLAVLRLASAKLADASIPFAMIGSIAAATLGDAAWPNEKEDIDFFVPEGYAAQARELFVDNGFTPDDTGPEWLLKAWREGILIDIIFRPSDIDWDADIESHITHREFHGLVLPMISAEDYVVMQTIAFTEETPQYWFNALGVLRHSEIDFDYLLRRTRRPDKMLSLLFYARSVGIHVPDHTIGALLDTQGLGETVRLPGDEVEARH